MRPGIEDYRALNEGIGSFTKALPGTNFDTGARVLKYLLRGMPLVQAPTKLAKIWGRKIHSFSFLSLKRGGQVSVCDASGFMPPVGSQK